MTKKIAVTLCAMAIAISTIFISNNVAKAEENTQENNNFNVIEYPPVTIDYFIQYKLEGGYDKNGLHAEYRESVNAIYFTGTINETVTSVMTMDLTETMSIMKGSTYSIYLYTTNESTGTTLHSNEIPGSIQNAIFANKFFKFTATTDTVRFYIAFKPNHTKNIYEGYYTLMIWQGDWELNKDISNSLSYQIGFNEGKIQGYENGHKKGYKDGMEQSAGGINDIFTGSTVEYNAIYGVDNTYNKTFTPEITGNTLSFGSLEDAPNTLKEENQKEVIDIITIYMNTSITIDIRSFTFTGFPIGTIVTIVGVQENNQNETQTTAITNSNNILYYFDYVYKPSYIYSKISKIIIESKYYTFNSANSAYEELNYSLYSKFNLLSIQPVTSLSYNEGYEKGYNQAETEYYNKWYIGRYQQGYNEGTNNAGNYTFLSLMGSVVDAPIKAISDMLNFEILGFNMMQFFYAIITVCIIVTIVKLLL